MGIIEKQSVQDIANAIRNRNGLTTLYKPREMDEAILNLYSTTKVNSMLDYILPCYEKEATSYTIQYADADRPCSITKLEGNTTQTGTPTPTNPIPISTVSGDNEVVVCGKNRFNKSNNIVSGYTFGGTGNLVSDSGFWYQNYFIGVEPNTTYYFSGSKELNVDSLRVCEYTADKTFIKRNYEVYTITTSATTRFIRVSNRNGKLDTLMISTSPITTYEPYTGNSYRVDLGGKNKFNYANTTITNSGITTTYNNGEISYSGTATTTYANLTDVTSLSLPAGTYTFSREGTNNVKLTLRVWNASNVRTDYNINANSNSTTFTISEKTDRTYLFLAGLTANTEYSGNIKVQLEKRKYSNKIQSLCI